MNIDKIARAINPQMWDVSIKHIKCCPNAPHNLERLREAAARVIAEGRP